VNNRRELLYHTIWFYSLPYFLSYVLLYQHHSITGYPFLAAWEAEAVGCCCFHTDLIDIKMQMFCQVGAHGLCVGSQFGAFSDDGSIDIANPVLILT